MRQAQSPTIICLAGGLNVEPAFVPANRTFGATAERSTSKQQVEGFQHGRLSRAVRPDQEVYAGMKLKAQGFDVADIG